MVDYRSFTYGVNFKRKRKNEVSVAKELEAGELTGGGSRGLQKAKPRSISLSFAALS